MAILFTLKIHHTLLTFLTRCHLDSKKRQWGYFISSIFFFFFSLETPSFFVFPFSEKYFEKKKREKASDACRHKHKIMPLLKYFKQKNTIFLLFSQVLLFDIQNFIKK